MSDGTRYAARYFDGKTVRAQDVSIALTEEGIAIYRQTGILLATWASGNIVLAERPRRGEAARIGLEGTTARLIVEDPGVIEQLSEIAPAAHRRIRANRKAVFKIGAWSGLAIGAVAVIVLVLIPLLSAQLAERTPESVKRRIGNATLDQIVDILPRLPTESGQVKFCTDPEGLTALRRLTDRMMAGAETIPDLRLTVVNAKLVNAFALPGGIVVLTDGLLRSAKSPEEIAGVLAHEIGHVVYAHPTQAIFRTTAVSLLISAMIGDFTGGILIAGVAEWALNSAYSRDAEREADDFAVQRLNAANVDGEGLALFFEHIMKEAGESGEESEDSVFKLISTHPPSAERLAFIRSNASGTGKAMTAAEWNDLKWACLTTADRAP